MAPLSTSATLRIPLFHHRKLLPAQWTRKNYSYRHRKQKDSGFNTGFPLVPPTRNYPIYTFVSLRPAPPLRPLFPRRPPCHPFPLSPTNMTTSTPVTAQVTPDQSTPSSPKTVRVVIKGRVQGVFYRDWTVENATQLGIKGWVRNRKDGSVEALFSGDSDKVQEMEQRCRRGPSDAMVTALQVFPSDDDPGTRFERKRTV